MYPTFIEQILKLVSSQLVTRTPNKYATKRLINKELKKKNANHQARLYIDQKEVAPLWKYHRLIWENEEENLMDKIRYIFSSNTLLTIK